MRLAGRLMGRHGDGSTPIWVSEFGWGTGGVKLQRSPIKATLSQQAHKLTKTYALFQRNAGNLGIARALWFSYSDRPPIGPDFWTNHAGLFTVDGKAKPAWSAYAAAAGGTP